MLFFMDNKGNVNLKVTRDAAPLKISRAMREKTKMNIRNDMTRTGRIPPDFDIDFPEVAPFYYGLLVDDEKLIYVQRTSSSEAVDEGYVFDVFDSKGIFIYSVKMDHYPYLIKNGCLYTVIVDDETGTESVARFRINNWSRYISPINIL